MSRFVPRAGLTALLSALLFIAACAPLSVPEPEPEPAQPRKDQLVLRPASFDDLPGWRADRHGEALQAFLRSCDKLLRRGSDAKLGGVIPGSVAAWRGACEAAGARDIGDHQAARFFFEDWFEPYSARNHDRERGLFTGYFEPELSGAKAPSDKYNIALYRRPGDLVTVSLGRFRDAFKGERIAGRVVDGALLPYPNRAKIDAGALAGQNLELVWVDSAVDAFFLHIQGSGRVQFQDGGARRIAYAAANGQPYLAIGRNLIAMGALTRENVSMQSIRTWLESHPGEAPAVMQENNSYIFFRWLDGAAADLGPEGAQGVALLAGRSLAVDRRFIGLGMPIWLDASAPDLDPSQPDRTIRRLMVSQDTGGAIRGPVRGDVFWGTGRDAGEIAGRMKHQGRYWLLLPRGLDVSALVN
ncbi:MAG: murein transglycosylase [Rhodospirillaceae bacterium]|nr:murein transglycosylase [Rhodospirillaceae bacterium]